MRFSRFLIGLFISCFLLLGPFLFGQELPFTHYTPESEVNPLPSAEVHSIHQDRLGFVWMAVYSSGLVRYDGHKTELYTVGDGLPALTVRQVFEDDWGRIWVASNAGLAVSDRPLQDYAGQGRVRFITRIGSTELTRTAIFKNRVAVDNKGSVWVGTQEDGIIRYRMHGVDSISADTLKTDIHAKGKNIDVSSLTCRQNGEVWVSVYGGDLLVIDPDSEKYELLTYKDGVPRSGCDVLYEGRSGFLYGGCRNGILWALENAEGHRRIKIVSQEQENRITAIAEERDKTLWLATFGSGVMRISDQGEPGTPSGSQTQHVIYTKKNGFLSDNVNDVMIDREGNLWFAQFGGLSKLRADYGAFVNYTSKSVVGGKSVLPDPSINAVIPMTVLDSKGICVATSEGGVTIMKENREIESIRTDRGLRDNWANTLTVDSQGRLWIGTQAGINCLSLDPRYPPPYSPEVRPIDVLGHRGSLAAYRKTTIISAKVLPLRHTPEKQEKVESIWFPGYQTLYCLVENEWIAFSTSSGLPATFFHAVAVDKDGRLWVGTRDAGLYRSIFPITVKKLRELRRTPISFFPDGKGGTFGGEVIMPMFEQVWDQSRGAPSNQIENIAWHEGALWVGTTEGLAVLDGDPPRMVNHLTTDDGLQANDIFGLAFSPATGSLWVGTNGGLAEIDPTKRRVLQTVTKQDGLVDNEVWYYGSVVAGEDGTIYFGTAKGLSIFHPELLKRNPVPPLLSFRQTDLTEDNRGNNEIAFEYAALSFANEKLVRYKTRLVGYDEEWSREKSEVKIRYTNLPAFLSPKTYTFEVIASNNHGVWTTQPLSHSFAVRPPWWFRWWALGADVVFLVASVYGYSRYRIKQLQERARQLEKTVAERTEEVRLQAKELEVKNVELEEKNQEILRTQEQLIMQEKLASLGALTAGIAHEIKNPLNFVNNFADLSVELVQELREDILKHKEKLEVKTFENIEDLLEDLEHNATKISEHGKRADGIVRGMLLHSRGKTGERMPSDLNVLLDDAIQLAYHGLRAQDPDFNIAIEKDYDKTIGELDVIPQDLSRVFINVVNNSCYATNEKRKSTRDSYDPKLSVSTKNLMDKVEIRIRDNGTGIPPEVVKKVFNPFFTTKPTGKGTGLGLSLSYDIVVKEHNGEIRVESEEGSYTEFIITIPKVAKKT
jgi:signal transduction histidine kinase/ligand-binding sensor domain-containing protein